MLTELKPVDELNHAQLDKTVVERWRANKFIRLCKIICIDASGGSAL